MLYKKVISNSKNDLKKQDSAFDVFLLDLESFLNYILLNKDLDFSVQKKQDCIARIKKTFIESKPNYKYFSIDSFDFNLIEVSVEDDNKNAFIYYFRLSKVLPSISSQDIIEYGPNFFKSKKRVLKMKDKFDLLFCEDSIIRHPNLLIRFLPNGRYIQSNPNYLVAMTFYFFIVDQYPLMIKIKMGRDHSSSVSEEDYNKALVVEFNEAFFRKCDTLNFQEILLYNNFKNILFYQLFMNDDSSNQQFIGSMNAFRQFFEHRLSSFKDTPS